MPNAPSVSYSSTLRVKLSSRTGTLGELTTARGRAGADIGAIDIVNASREAITRDITFTASSSEHVKEIVEAARDIDGVEVVNVSDRTFLLHLGGKIEVVSKSPLKTRNDLSMAYTPGVARICEAIHRDPEKAFTLTIKRNPLAAATDGPAALGLAALPPAPATSLRACPPPPAPPPPSRPARPCSAPAPPAPPLPCPSWKARRCSLK